MLKAGIFLDIENLMRNGGWGIRYDVLKDLVVAQGAIVLRANAYMAWDEEREKTDQAISRAKGSYRGAIRRNGFHLVLKEVRRYRDAEGAEVVKANSDLDLAVDAILQSENLDYVLLGTGDGDFIRVVRALQNHGKRVDLLSFWNTNRELRREVDNHFNGFLIPGLVRSDEVDPNRSRGTFRSMEEEKGYGFLSFRAGLGPGQIRDDVFLHISDFTRDGTKVSNAEFAALRERQAIVEFDLGMEEGRPRARNAREMEGRPVRSRPQSVLNPPPAERPVAG